MTLNDLKNKWKKLASDMSTKGIPLPSIRDPKTKLGSISLTLVLISFTMVIVGLVGKWAGALGGIDLTQALNLFYACAALYWGRKFQSKDVSPVGPQAKPDQTPPADDPDQP